MFDQFLNNGRGNNGRGKRPDLVSASFVCNGGTEDAARRKKEKGKEPDVPG